MTDSARQAAPRPLHTVQPPTITWPTGGDAPPGLSALACPNCGSLAPKDYVLTIDVELPDSPARRLHIVQCPGCDCRFYDSQVPPDYAEPKFNDRGRVPFYVQQGAGVSLITRPLAQARHAPGAAYLEVGCGFGFGLDFALNTRGWQGFGIDPAALAALGREAFGLPIELRYLRDDDEARGTMDVVLGSEVIEHVTSPAAFVRTLRAMLRPGGLMILTTPNGRDIHRGSPPGIIIPLLSPSLHLVIQTEASLRWLLTEAGFAHVAIEIDSHSLVAFASDAPLDLEQDAARLRAALRAHLHHRAATLEPTTDLFLGFAGRAFQESVNDSEMEEADQAWARLVPAVQQRFRFDLDALVALPPDVATCGLEEMAARVPLNLAGLLYARAIRRMASGTPRPALEASFRLASEAADAMRRALGELAMEDGQTEDIGWTALAEAALCAAARGAPDILQCLDRLPPAPAGGAARVLAIKQRALAILVDAGHTAAARELAESLPEPDATDPAGRDALFARGILDLQPGGDPAAARRRFAQIRSAAPQESPLWWAALRGELQATTDEAEAGSMLENLLSRHPHPELAAMALPWLVKAGRQDLARQMVRRTGLDPSLTGPHTAAARDNLFYLAMLTVQDAAPEPAALDLAARRFAQVRLAADPLSGLWLAALRGEVQALDQAGQGAAALSLAIEQARAHPTAELGMLALPRLIDAGHHTEARELVRLTKLDRESFMRPMATGSLTHVQRDTLFHLAVLDAQIAPDGRAAGEPALARNRFARVRAVCEPGAGLWWGALRGELQSLDLMGAGAEAQGVVAAAAAAHPELALPDDIAARLGAT